MQSTLTTGNQGLFPTVTICCNFRYLFSTFCAPSISTYKPQNDLTTETFRTTDLGIMGLDELVIETQN